MPSFFSETSQMHITFIILTIAIILFVHGKIRADLVAVCSLTALVLFGILNPTEALSDFSSPVIIMMIGLFMISSAIFRTGLANVIGNKILGISGNNENRIFMMIFLITCGIGGFLSSTGTVAIMMPIVLSVCANASISPRRYLMPMAFASSLGLFTIISTPQNLIIQDIVTKSGYKPLSFFSFAPIGFICVILGMISQFFLSKMLEDEEIISSRNGKHKKLLNELVKNFGLTENTFKIYIPKTSFFIGKTIGELNISSKYNVSITKIIHLSKTSSFTKEIKEDMATPSTIINKGSVLFCQGAKEDVENFIKDNGLDFFKGKKLNPFDFRSIGISDIFILPNSKLIGRTVADIKFRETYGVKVIGIKNKDGHKFKINDIKNTTLAFGDSLLLEGPWKDLDALYDEPDDFILQGRPLKEASELAYTEKAPITAIIMILMVLAMVFNIVPSVISVIIAVLLIIFTGCLRSVEEAYNSVSWKTIVLMAGMMPMAKAFDKTGITALLSENIISYIGNMGPYALLTVIYICATIMTTFISNVATTILIAPIALKAALLLGLSPMPFLFATTVAATMSFTSPFSTAPNALVMSVGKYKFTDYLKVGFPLQVAIGFIMIFALPLIYPF